MDILECYGPLHLKEALEYVKLNLHLSGRGVGAQGEILSGGPEFLGTSLILALFHRVA